MRTSIKLFKNNFPFGLKKLILHGGTGDFLVFHGPNEGIHKPKTHVNRVRLHKFFMHLLVLMMQHTVYFIFKGIFRKPR